MSSSKSGPDTDQVPSVWFLENDCSLLVCEETSNMSPHNYHMRLERHMLTTVHFPVQKERRGRHTAVYSNSKTWLGAHWQFLDWSSVLLPSSWCAMAASFGLWSHLLNHSFFPQKNLSVFAAE